MTFTPCWWVIGPFGYGKVPKKEKKIAKENDFFMFGCSIKNTKEKQT